MVQYKLTYFNGRGLAEATRQMFHLANVEFEDNRVEFGTDEWEKLKPITPFGQLPVLNVDGFEIPQSAAIGRFIAQKLGYAGKTPEEQAWVDAIVDQFKDFMNQFCQYVVASLQGSSVEEIEKLKNTVAEPSRDAYFAVLNKILSKSKSGFLVGDNLTWADLVVSDNLTTLQKQGFFDASTEPKLAEFYKKINEIPELKAWIDKRPDTPF